MVVVGLLYNHNGMATWCLEVAYALHNDGQEVLLIIDKQQRPDLLNNNFPFKTYFWSFEVSPHKKNIIQKVWTVYDNYFKHESPRFAFLLENKLKSDGIVPNLFLLNQSDLHDNRCKIPQFVVAWAFPCTLFGYLKKSTRQSATFFSLKSFISILNAITWYKKDWAAYKRSTQVLGVSQKIVDHLQRSNIKADLLFPPLNVNLNSEIKHEIKKVKVLFIALDLENPQKRIEWAIRALSEFKELINIEIHFIGSYTYLKDLALGLGLNGIFYGNLPRNKVKEIMEECDLLVFCSSFDDWGYVQVEAMAMGMAVISPLISPCDEIIGNPELLFQANNKKSFLKCFGKTVDKNNLLQYKEYCKNRSHLFSHESFLKKLKMITG
ncbi:MAG: glycosyltransferase [Opitutaceae bacterium]|nr:glycosyltransferase [Cytophagales bacterium]